MLRSLTLGVLLLFIAVPGCGTKKKLDASVDEIVGGLGACDRPRVTKVISASGHGQLEAGFDEMCKTIAWFGPLTERKQTGIHVGTGGSSGTYDLTFEKGSLRLSLTIVDDEVAGFEFTGEDWEEARKALHAEKYAEFKVYEFAFRDKDGNENAAGNKYPRGRVPWAMKLGGLATKDGKHRIGIKTRIRKADGPVMFESPKFNPIEFEARADIPSVVGNISDVAHIPEVGTFHLEFDLRDELSGKETTTSQTVVIE
ncbi:MAG: hypothetical protein AAF721_34170 [Myxococcota bacterium]